MPSGKRIPEETKATIRALKATEDLTLEEIAQRCKVSRTIKCTPPSKFRGKGA